MQNCRTQHSTEQFWYFLLLSPDSHHSSVGGGGYCAVPVDVPGWCQVHRVVPLRVGQLQHVTQVQTTLSREPSPTPALCPVAARSHHFYYSSTRLSFITAALGHYVFLPCGFFYLLSYIFFLLLLSFFPRLIGRAVITLGVGPHSSYSDFFHSHNTYDQWCKVTK